MSPNMEEPGSSIRETLMSTKPIKTPESAVKRPLTPSSIELENKRHCGTNFAFNDLSTDLGCPKCYQLFSVPYALQRHLGTVHSSKERFPCAECKRIFTRKDSLDRHRAAHVKAGFAICAGCMKAMRPDYMRTHLAARKNWTCALAQNHAERASHAACDGSSTPELTILEVATGSSDCVRADSQDETSVEQNDRNTGDTDDLCTRSITQAVDENEAVHTSAPALASSTQMTVVPPSPTVPSQEVTISSPTTVGNDWCHSLTNDDTRNDRTATSYDPLLFELDEEDTRDVSEDLRAEIRQWDKLEALATCRSLTGLSSVVLRVRKHIIKQHKPRKTALSSGCKICGANMGDLGASQVQHLVQHLQHGLETRFRCPACYIGFVFKKDLEQHR